MAGIPLSSNSGDQTSTQTPQAAQSASGGGVSSGSVQPGTANAALQSNQGISLTPTPVSTVALSGGTGQATTALPAQKHLNPVLVGFTVVLLVVAAVLFWAVSASGKKHNQY